MPDDSRLARRRRRLAARAQDGVPANVRLFVLLALLLPLFGGLQYLAQEAAPRDVASTAPPRVVEAVPVLVRVERPVERIVFVPVERLDEATGRGGDPGTAPVVVASSAIALAAPEPVVASIPPADPVAAPRADTVPPANEAPVAEAVPPAAPAFAPAVVVPPAEEPVMGIVALVPRAAPAPRASRPSSTVREPAPSTDPDAEPVAGPEDGDEAEAAASPDESPGDPNQQSLPLIGIADGSGGPSVVVYVPPRRVRPESAGGATTVLVGGDGIELEVTNQP